MNTSGFSHKQHYFIVRGTIRTLQSRLVLNLTYSHTTIHIIIYTTVSHYLQGVNNLLDILKHLE